MLYEVITPVSGYARVVDQDVDRSFVEDGLDHLVDLRRGTRTKLPEAELVGLSEVRWSPGVV